LASGHSAIFLTLINLAKAGDEIVASSLIYGGAINLLGVSLKKLGIDVKFVDPRVPDNFKAATTKKTKAYIVEAIGIQIPM
jgi:O-acetylhomoserine (thiol)-lyase